MTTATAFEIGGQQVKPGTRATINLSLGSFANQMPATMPVRVVHGRRSGPTLFVSAAVHGDEIIGVEIVRRLLQSRAVGHLKGTLLCIPVVNTFGFISHSRYLPDRRDLNRSFPGAASSSLAGQLAHLFMTEIVARSDYGIDLHSASAHRVNLPQVRVCSNREKTRLLAQAFGAPLILEAPLRGGTLRDVARSMGVDVLLYESGEALRFDEYAVRVGVRGILNVLAHVGMISPPKKKAKPPAQSVVANRSKWTRSPIGGVFRSIRTIGDTVTKGDILGFIADPFGDNETAIVAQNAGVIIGRTNLPIVNPGDALFHTAFIKRVASAGEKLQQIEEEIEADPLFDEDEII